MYANDQRTRRIQEELLELLQKFHNACVDNNISYTLHGGSLLGAIREKGFIPWDDDADVGITRENYKKLHQAFAEGRFPGMELDNQSDKIYRIWQIENREIWIDLFIYDYVSDFRPARQLKVLGIKLLSAFAKDKDAMKRFRVNARAKGLKRIVFELLYRFGCMFRIEKRVKLFDAFSQYCFQGHRRTLHRSNDQLVGMEMFFPAECFARYMLVPFESLNLMVNAGYQEILIESYGENYMIPRKANDVDMLVHEMTRG